MITLDQAKLDTRKLGTNFNTDGDLQPRKKNLRSLVCKDSGKQ